MSSFSSLAPPSPTSANHILAMEYIQSIRDDKFSLADYLCINCSLCNFEYVKMALEAGVDPCVKNSKGQLPIVQATSSNSTRCINILLKYGADINQFESEGDYWGAENALCCAVYFPDLDLVKFLLDRGADPSLGGSKLNTPLHRIFQCDGVHVDIYIKTFKLLIDNGANIHARNYEGQTPLHYAVSSTEMLECIEILLDKGANVNEQDNKGDTPLHRYAHDLFYEDEIDYAHLLLKRGAYLNVKNNKGETPLDIAKSKENVNDKLVTLLSEYQDLPE